MKESIRRIAAFAVIGASIFASDCGRHDNGQVRSSGTPANEIAARDLAQRTRINGFFYAVLVPKLKTCWGRISGKGEIEFKLIYRKAEQSWDWQQAELESKVPAAQSTAALACMQDSSRGSSFPATPEEARMSQFTIHWAWPIPFPDNTSELGMMINPGGSDPPPQVMKCWACGVNPPGSARSAECKRASSGYNTCTNHDEGNGCTMCCTDARCVSGWSGAWGGEAFIASAKRPPQSFRHKSQVRTT